MHMESGPIGVITDTPVFSICDEFKDQNDFALRSGVCVPFQDPGSKSDDSDWTYVLPNQVPASHPNLSGPSKARRRSLLPGDTSTNMRSGSAVLTSARHSDYNATGLNTRSCDLSQRNLCLTCDESRALTGVISVIMHDNLRPNFQIDLGDRPTFRFDISRRSFRDVVK